MADPLSIAAGVVGLVVPALHGARLLVEDIQKILDAPDTIRSLHTELLSLTLILQSLRAIDEAEWQGLGGEVAEQFGHTLRVSGQTCERFRTDLRRWTRDSKDGRLSWKSRATVGLFRERQIKAMTQQVQSCKLNCSCVIGMGNLYATLRARRPVEDVKSAVRVTVQAINQNVAHAAVEAPKASRVSHITPSSRSSTYASSYDINVERANEQDEEEDSDLGLDLGLNQGYANVRIGYGRQRTPPHRVAAPASRDSSGPLIRGDCGRVVLLDRRRRTRSASPVRDQIPSDDEMLDESSFEAQAALSRTGAESNRALLDLLKERMLPDELSVFANSIALADEIGEVAAELDMQELLLLAEVSDPVEAHIVLPIENIEDSRLSST